MAVEKMKLMNIVAPIEDMHDILKELVLTEKFILKTIPKTKLPIPLTMSLLTKYEDPIRDMGIYEVSTGKG